MTLLSGITPKGTIWVKNLDKKGRVFQKRVVRQDGIQFDTLLYPKSGRPAYYLMTNWNDNSQFLCKKITQKPWYTKLFPKFYNKVPKTFTYMENMDEWMQKGTKGQIGVGFYQGSTGFATPEINNAVANLKNEYLSKLFR